MKKKSTSKRKPAAKAGTMKRLATKALKLVKSTKGSAAGKTASAKSAKKAGKAKKPVATTVSKAKPKPAKKASGPKAAAPTKSVSRPAAPTSRPKVAPVPRPPVSVEHLSEDDIRRMPEHDYMNDVQLEFFRRRLLQMRQEVLDREMDVKERLNQREVFADPADRATAEEEHWLDLRLRERESLLLKKIDEALRRIKDREYGYCEVTGEPIGVPRLLARPTATVCVDVKGQNEQIESQYRDR